MSHHSVGNQPALSENIILVGNHNVGKSVIFGWLTGTYTTVANYPGTTVEITRGVARNNSQRGIIDTPGVNSLQPHSEDERVTRDVLLDESAHAVIQVADAKNLRRALFITSQLAEYRVPLVLVLNMMDEAYARGVAVDAAQLTEKIGAPIVPTVATSHQGMEELLGALKSPDRVAPLVQFDDRIEGAIRTIEAQLNGNVASRAVAAMFLSKDESIETWLRPRIDAPTWDELIQLRAELESHYDTPLSTVIQNARVAWVDTLVRDVYVKRDEAHESFTSKLGRWMVHPVWGVPILIAALFLMYQFVGKFGAGTLVNFIEGTFFGEWVNPIIANLVHTWIPIPIAQDFLIGPYGIITVALTYGFAIIFPIVSTFFIAFGILEDSGYLPRLAVMANQVFRAMGLNGKAVLPMVLGLGCDTMATMTTRTLETKKDRIIVTLLLALGVPCSAQLGVVLGLLAGLDIRATIIWTAVVVGVMLVVGWLAAKVIPGTGSDFIVELPPIRVPILSHLMIKTLARLEWYLKEVLPLFLIGTVILFAFDKLGALAVIEHVAEPLVVNGLGLPPAATEMFLIGFLRRDYGAAGFFLMARQGLLTPTQIIVALVTITLFVPCIANFFVMVKERGLNTALAITAFIFPFAFAVGALLNWVLHLWN